MWNIARVDGDWTGRKVLFVVYVTKVLQWLKVHYKLAMGGAPQVAMCVALQIWQIVFASQTLKVFRLALRKKAQYVVVMIPHIHRGEMWNYKKRMNYYMSWYRWVNSYKCIASKTHDVKCIKRWALCYLDFFDNFCSLEFLGFLWALHHFSQPQ